MVFTRIYEKWNGYNDQNTDIFPNDINIYKFSTIDVKLIDNDPFIASRQRKIILKSAKVQFTLRKRKKGVSLVWDISILTSFRKSSYESAKWIN